MFERFTDKARRVLVRAQEAAQAYEHNYLGSEHLLLGLLADTDTTAAEVFDALGIDRADLRRAMDETLVPSPPAHAAASSNFTPRAKKVLELSLREALELRADFIGTEHLLLGLVREGGGATAVALRERGVDLDRARREVAALAGTATREFKPAGAPRNADWARLYANAIRRARPDPPAAHDFLLALFDDPDSLAARALLALGLTAEVVAAKVDELGPAGGAVDASTDAPTTDPPD